jgi:hypothetical protein
MKVGYVPYSQDLSHPADRRRLAMWASELNVDLGILDPLDCDLLVLSNAANFSYWMHKTNKPVILDLVDGYLGEAPPLYKDVARNILRTVSGSSQFLWFRYTNHLKFAIRNCSAVIVASPEQRESVLPFNNNVYVIQDDHSELEIEKMDLNSSQCNEHAVHLFWEGYGYTLKHFRVIATALDTYLNENNYGLYLLTNLEFPKWGGFLGRYKTEKLIRKWFPKSFKQFHIISWSLEEVVDKARKSKLAIIPVDTNDKFAALKPENKLLSMWHLNLPTLFSPIDSYLRVQGQAGIAADCRTPLDWVTKINELVNSEVQAKHDVKASRLFLSSHHTKPLLAAKWGTAIEDTFRK